jgi:uncharacterized protein
MASPARFGLGEETIKKINAVFSRYPEIESVVIYGSRVKGTHQPASDIDLTIKGSLDLSKVLKIESQLDDLLLPYKIDLSLFHQLDNEELIDHVTRVGQVFYLKS